MNVEKAISSLFEAIKSVQTDYKTHVYLQQCLGFLAETIKKNDEDKKAQQEAKKEIKKEKK